MGHFGLFWLRPERNVVLPGAVHLGRTVGTHAHFHAGWPENAESSLRGQPADCCVPSGDQTRCAIAYHCRYQLIGSGKSSTAVEARLACSVLGRMDAFPVADREAVNIQATLLF
jgi:hypothetical protein